MNADDLAKILDELGQRLGPTGEHVFALAVRQQIVVGALSLLAAVTLGIVGAVIGYWEWRKEDPPILLGPIIAAFGVIPLAFALMTLLNPEYAAIHDLIRIVKP